MYTSHKEKERLRHQKQVKLLNQVMKHVPKVSNETQTKVRKLRSLILYTHYLRMVHSEITNKYAKVDDHENSVVDKAVDLSSDNRKSPCKSMRNLRSKRANIVFLQADKSSNSTRKTKKNSVDSQCNKKLTASSAGYNYEMPEFVPMRDVMSMEFDPEATCISENAYHSQIDNESNTSFRDQESSKSESLNVNKQASKSLESSLSTKSLSYIDKESYKSTSHVTQEDELFDEFSLYKDSPSSLFSKDNSIAKHKSNTFHPNSQHSSNMLKQSQFSNSENTSNNYSHLSSDMNQESLLHSLYSDRIQNASSDYGSFSLPNEFQITHPFYNFYQSDFSFNFVSKMLPQNYLSVSAENASSDTSSCPSNDRISVDVEYNSDSNPSCNSVSDSSNSAQYNTYDPYPDSGHSSFKVEEKQNHPVDESVVYEPREIDYSALPMYPPYLGKNILRDNVSNKAMYDIPYSYVDSIYPPSIPFNRSSYGIPIFSESNSKNFRKYENNYSDSDSFYLPSFNDSFHNEFSLIQPKLEVVDDTTYTSDSFCKENVKPYFFEEEASYPLSKYFTIDK